MFASVRRLVTTFALSVIALGSAAPAFAQSLDVLHVKSVALSVDRTDVVVGEIVDVVIDIKVTETIAQLDNVTLPPLYGFDPRGDERSCVVMSGGAGTECTERLALSPNRAGALFVGPAVLEALNAATGKPTTYPSNVVTVRVSENPNATSNVDDPFAPVFGPIIHWFVIAVIVAIVVVAVFALVMFLLARRIAGTSKTIAVVPPPVVAAPPKPDADARLRALVRALEDEPSRMRALALRAELRSRVGARSEETLADLYRRRAGDERVLHLLSIVERAAFVEEPDVAAAAREAVVQIRQILSVASSPPPVMAPPSPPAPPMGGPS